MAGGRPLKFPDVEALQAQIDDFFAECDAKEEPYTITRLALALNTSRETLCEYEEREQFVDTIKNAKLRCEGWIEKNMLMGKANPTGSIFSLKNNYGWKDKTESDQTVNVNGKMNIQVEFIE